MRSRIHFSRISLGKMEPAVCKPLGDLLRRWEVSALGTLPVCRVFFEQEQRRWLDQYKQCLKEAGATNTNEDRQQSKREIQY